MGGSRIFDWGGPRIDEARDAGQNVAIFALKSWTIRGAMALWPPPLEPPLKSVQTLKGIFFVKVNIFDSLISSSKVQT